MTSDEPAATAPIGVVLALLRADAPAEILGNPQAWPRWAELLPHVLAATGQVGDPSWRVPEAAWPHASWLLDRASAYLRVHARLAEARPLAERALAIDQAAYGPDHPAVAISLDILKGLRQSGGASPGAAGTSHKGRRGC